MNSSGWAWSEEEWHATSDRDCSWKRGSGADCSVPQWEETTDSFGDTCRALLELPLPFVSMLRQIVGLDAADVVSKLSVRTLADVARVPESTFEALGMTLVQTRKIQALAADHVRGDPLLDLTKPSSSCGVVWWGCGEPGCTYKVYKTDKRKAQKTYIHRHKHTKRGHGIVVDTRARLYAKRLRRLLDSLSDKVCDKRFVDLPAADAVDANRLALVCSSYREYLRKLPHELKASTITTYVSLVDNFFRKHRRSFTAMASPECLAIVKAGPFNRRQAAYALSKFGTFYATFRELVGDGASGASGASLPQPQVEKCLAAGICVGAAMCQCSCQRDAIRGYRMSMHHATQVLTELQDRSDLEMLVVVPTVFPRRIA